MSWQRLRRLFTLGKTGKNRLKVTKTLIQVRHGIDDIRRLFTSDLRFLEQF